MNSGKIMTHPALHIDSNNLPNALGAYILLIELDGAVVVHLPKRREATLPAGRYLYCGSAYGPGGIKARVGRHMIRHKNIRWHVDQLTTAGTVLGAWTFPGENECVLVGKLSGLPVPIPGFGSSDCRACKSHLLFWPDGFELPLEQDSNR